MRTLTEIEEHMAWLDDREHDKSFAEFNRITDTRLLIRAVRQLGARLEELHKYRGIDYGFIDDDVLALLEEGR